MSLPVIGVPAHERAVAVLRASYGALAPDVPVRLAKRTSNLFRPRERVEAGLDARALDAVISIDRQARTADVQGMCTYEHLVQATVACGLMPLVVPQLRTITIGGAVSGLGVESSSLRNGLPHESVLEMDILTGSGEIITASPDQHIDLFAAFPNSYGTLGYAVRLRIRLEPVAAFVALRHVRFDEPDDLVAAIASIAETGAWLGEQVDFVDGVMFRPAESYLCLGRWAEHGPASDYKGQQIYYRSIRERERDCLSTQDYVWRWDTDWFWCSAAFGAQQPLVRRLWPRRYRRSDIYHRIIGWENRYGVVARVDRWRGRPGRERVVQDVEIPLERTAEFLEWFVREVQMTPVWLCPLRSRRPWPLYPLEPGRVYVNIGFWGTVPIRDGAGDGQVNRAIERAVEEFGGHKSLYSDAYYDRQRFDALYGGAAWADAKARYDPDGRLTGMYEKVVQRR
ncbi:MAG: FAD-binding oxidoreductase [Jatrophihabitantaceae bacterium]